MHILNKIFKWISRAVGHPLNFLAVAIGLLIWFQLGGDLTQINLAISIYTLFTTIVITNSQTREADVNKLQTEEILRAVPGADNKLIGIEEPDEQPTNTKCT